MYRLCLVEPYEGTPVAEWRTRWWVVARFLWPLVCASTKLTSHKLHQGYFFKYDNT